MLLHKSGMLYLWISASHHQSVLSDVILKHFILLQPFSFLSSDFPCSSSNCRHLQSCQLTLCALQIFCIVPYCIVYFSISKHVNSCWLLVDSSVQECPPESLQGPWVATSGRLSQAHCIAERLQRRYTQTLGEVTYSLTMCTAVNVLVHEAASW